MNTFQLECFFHVASSLSFACAAEELNVSQPAITHQIRSLENELNVKLFYRTTRNVSLTHEGELLLPEVNDLILRLHAVENRFSGDGERKFVFLQIGCMGDALFGLLPDVLYRLSSAEPGLHPILRSVPAPQLVKHMEDGYVDIALGIKEKLPKGSIIRYTELIKTPLVCVCDETHPLSERESIRLADMDEHSLIFFRPAVCAAEIAALQLELGKGRRAGSIFFCDDLTAAFTLARAGFGALLIPLVLVPDFLPGLTKVSVCDYPSLSFGVYCKPNGGKLQNQFIQLLRKRLDVPQKTVRH